MLSPFANALPPPAVQVMESREQVNCRLASIESGRSVRLVDLANANSSPLPADIDVATSIELPVRTQSETHTQATRATRVTRFNPNLDAFDSGHSHASSMTIHIHTAASPATPTTSLPPPSEANDRPRGTLRQSLITMATTMVGSISAAGVTTIVCCCGGGGAAGGGGDDGHGAMASSAGAAMPHFF